MPFIKITYRSPNNISVQGTDYFEVEEYELYDDGSVPESVIDRTWQEAVNDFMSDTDAEIVESEGE
ncbi:hypothetical protein [Streptomyces ardesiacus]|uniref:hypothetical protein n=1 Tax=Streptomyces ardesiacus TaxID=285564 RepID=UPI00364FC8CB